MLSFINEEEGKTHSKALCPRFATCKARLCPLDQPPVAQPPFCSEDFCYYYVQGGKPQVLDVIPEFLLRPLVEYSAMLLELGIVSIDLSKEPG